MAYICNGCSDNRINAEPCVIFAPGVCVLPEYCPFDGGGLCKWQEIPDDKAIKVINEETNQGERNARD